MAHEYIAPFIEVSVAQYSKMTGLKPLTIRRRCERGLFDAYKVGDSKGSHWKIKIRPEDSVSREELEALRRENIELKATLDAVRRTVAVSYSG